MTVLVFVFAFSSVLGNYVYAEVNLFFLGANKTAINVFRVVVLGAIALGATSKLATVWDLADVAMGLMAMVNLVAIVLLGKWAFAVLHDYQRQAADGRGPGVRRRRSRPARHPGRRHLGLRTEAIPRCDLAHNRRRLDASLRGRET